MEFTTNQILTITAATISCASMALISINSAVRKKIWLALISGIVSLIAFIAGYQYVVEIDKENKGKLNKAELIIREPLDSSIVQLRYNKEIGKWAVWAQNFNPYFPHWGYLQHLTSPSLFVSFEDEQFILYDTKEAAEADARTYMANFRRYRATPIPEIPKCSPSIREGFEPAADISKQNK